MLSFPHSHPCCLLLSSLAPQWHELADLYLSVGQYKHAAFCYEDLILADPMSYLLHCRLAEILYTMGGHDNFLAARKYFSQSLHLKKSNPRALFGLAQCTQALSKTKLAKVDAEVNSAVHAYASEERCSTLAWAASP